MSLTPEDKKDVSKSMGKALANKVSQVTKDRKAASLKKWLAVDKTSAGPKGISGGGMGEAKRQFRDIYSKTSDAPDSPRAHHLMDKYREKHGK